MRISLKKPDNSALSFMPLGLSPLEETSMWLVSASKSWSDLVPQELLTPAQIHCLTDFIHAYLKSLVFQSTLIQKCIKVFYPWHACLGI